MAISNVLYTGIFDNEDEEDGATFVEPKSRGGGGLVVHFCVEANFGEVFGEHASLG